MIRYSQHREVSKEHKLLLKEMEGIDSIEEYTIGKINSLVNDILKEQESLNKFKNFEVAYSSDGVTTTKKFTTFEQALVFVDQLTNYGAGSDIALVLSQAGKPIRGYHNRKWIYPRSIYDL